MFQKIQFRNYFIMKEIFKDIYGYKNIYQISNLHRIKSMQRIDARGVHRKQMFLKSTSGYVSLCKGGVQKTISISKLIENAFIDNMFA